MLFLLLVGISTIFAVYSVFRPEKSKWQYSALVMLAGVAAGLRIDVGRDYPVYELLFEGRMPVSSIEPGFFLYARLLSLADATGRLGFVVSALLICIGYALFIRAFLQRYYIFAWHIFLCIPVFYINSLNLLRQHLAIAIVLSGFYWLRRGRYIGYMIHLLVGGLFHYSVALLSVFVLYKKIKIKPVAVLYPVILVLMPIAILAIEDVMISGSKYAYFVANETRNSPLLAFAFFVLNLCVFLLLVTRRNDFERVRELVGISSCVSCVFIAAWIFSGLGTFWLRVASLFYSPLLVGLPTVFECLRPLRYRQYLMLLTIFLATVVFFLTWLPDGSFGYVG